MNILFLSIYQFNEFAGGIDRVCVLLIRQFLKDGHNVSNCFSVNSIEGRCANGLEGCLQFKFPDEDITSKANKVFLKNIIKENSIQYVIDECYRIDFHSLCVELQKEIDFRLIYHCHTDPLAPLKSLRDNIEIVSLKESSFFLSVGKRIFMCLKYPIVYFIRRRHLKAKWRYYCMESDVVVTLSQGFKESIVNLVKEDVDSKVHCITNPINLVSGPFKEKKQQIVFVGRLAFQKRVDRLLDIWSMVERRCPDVQLIIVGDGEAKDVLIKYAQKLRLKNIHFLGARPSLDMIADSIALCMVSSHEGLGMTILEAKCRKTIPIVFGSYETVNEIINHYYDGIIVPPFSKKVFADSIIQVSTNISLRKTLSKNASISVYNNEISSVLSKWYCLFAELSK